MKNRIWILFALLINTSMILFSQGNSGNSWVAIGYQMNLTNIEKDDNWTKDHGFKFLSRFSMLSLYDNIGFGILFSGRLSFPKETYWVSPDTGNVNRITNAKSIYEFGSMLGVSLHGKIVGPIGFGVGTGLVANWVTAKMDTFFTLLYGDVDFELNVFDFGLGLNAGIKFDIGEFVIELGSDISFPLFKRDSYTYTSENKHFGTNGIIESDSISSKPSILRISPYVLIGLKIL